MDYYKVDPGEGITNILENYLEIPPYAIDSIILGHRHFDHIGDLGRFPTSVDLVLGPDSEKDLDRLVDYLDVPPQVLLGRRIRYLEREKDEWKDVGTFKGHDYFGDGSLYILDAPGVNDFFTILRSAPLILIFSIVLDIKPFSFALLVPHLSIIFLLPTQCTISFSFASPRILLSVVHSSPSYRRTRMNCHT